LRFCLDDGTELVNKTPEGGAPETLHMPSVHAQSTIKSPPSPQAIRPAPAALVKRRRLWPWMVGGAALLILAITIVTVGGFLMYLKKPLVHHLVMHVEYNSANRDEVVTLAVAVIKNRLNALGVSSFEVKPGTPNSGEILVNLPRLDNPERVKQIISTLGKLEFAHVISPASPQPAQTFPTQEKAQAFVIEHSDTPAYALPYHDEPDSQTQKWVILEQTPIISGSDIRQASATPSTGNANNYQVQFSLRPNGAERFATWTAAHINEYIAVVLNNEVKSIAYIRSQISDQGVITGRYTRQSAEDLALVLNTGTLPAPVTFVSEKIDN
jgi:protein-export membrane protein SecD